MNRQEIIAQLNCEKVLKLTNELNKVLESSASKENKLNAAIDYKIVIINRMDAIIEQLLKQ